MRSGPRFFEVRFERDLFVVPRSEKQKEEMRKSQAEYTRIWKERHPGRHAKQTRESKERLPNNIWVQYAIHRKKVRGFKVLFTWQELVQVVEQTPSCRYCGVALDYTPFHGYGRRHAPSLDRVDNIQSGDMRLEDVQIICYQCNTTKCDRSHVDFMEYCKKVASLE